MTRGRWRRSCARGSTAARAPRCAERPRIHRLSPPDDLIPDLALEADDLLLVSHAPCGLLGERPALAALVMSLAAQEPVVLAACPSE